MQEEWWERPTCFVCDKWWLFLLLLILGLAAFFTRDLWMPEQTQAGFQDVTVSQREVAVFLRDNGSLVDNDRVDITLNGDTILEDYTLTGPGETISVTLKGGRNTFTVIALNEGSSSPNTLEVGISHVTDGPPVQVSSGLLTGQSENLSVKAPRW